MIKKPALITFITAGDPNIDATLEFMLVLEKYADVIELGVPFSDPMADGRTIQKANYRALKSGTRIKDVFKVVEEFREHSSKPVVLMTYYNPVYRFGAENFIAEAKKSGVDGLIVVDLPIEEAKEYVEICRKLEIGTIFLAAPNTPDERLKMIDEASSAFVYLISLYGTTGSRSEIPESAFSLLSRAKRICRKPVAVGFGVSKAEHVKTLVEAGADGVVVGSAIVEIVEKFGENASEEIERKVRELRSGLQL
ncbi:tryptophan synthase, alpha subunit [Ferroglobus placidus DSM 10642]|uniref:Tryptophan synthase alpha chain n=1 Tax=Ferroglobus placidus (strain DSM 10642 / AEDII12DO) TaxID=589924 RepID=D3S074_FERPA|nr:tryptophan synthase subunit alpha [Ferroglobus placidus]ADC66137.1 tryptophan synthase, alpha subunit [Ferroglobus placidus DSM 10642]